MKNPVEHLTELVRKYPALEGCQSDVSEAFVLLKQSFETDGKLLLCGNGGSAADCEHWAGELLKGFASRRPLPADKVTMLGAACAAQLQGALPAIPLTGFLSLRTAFDNDCDPQFGFAQLVYGLGRPGDVLVGISTSGNAVNVGHALRVARAMGLKTIGLTGPGGGAVAGLVDVAIRVPGKCTYEIQELHLPVYHTLCLMLETAIF